jgi:hypothetical protein
VAEPALPLLLPCGSCSSRRCLVALLASLLTLLLPLLLPLCSSCVADALHV